MKKHLSDDEIISMLNAVDDPNSKQTIRREASIRQIMNALEKATVPLHKQILCDILGEREAKSAVSLLLQHTNNESRGVQIAAVDALAKIGNPRVGAYLFQLLSLPSQDIRLVRTIIIALGAVGYTPAHERLILALKSADESIRGGAVWSLGHMRIHEALPLMQELAKHEQSPYVLARLKEAMTTL